MIVVYNAAKDAMEEVTQEWCDSHQLAASLMHKQKLIINEISSWNIIDKREKIEKLTKELFGD